MAFEQLGDCFTLNSGDVALSASQYRFVQLGSAGTAVRAATAGQRGIVGVLQDKPANVGDPCLVAGGGITKVEAGSAITAGAKVSADSAGRAVTATAASSIHLYGRAIEAAAAAGNIISIVYGYDGNDAP